jgi:signal transduction histidine kinase
MDENDYQALIKKRELHGLVLALSTDTFQAVCFHDLWLRCIIAFFAGISAIGAGVAWRNLSKSSELQIRLVRASELNTHLKEMNLAAAGLAHETRNPLNIVRGLAQMISRRPDAPPEVQNKSREIIDETDKVTAQLNEFINYSRPRELRRSALALNPVASEVVRALNFDIEEKGIRVGIQGEPLVIEADEQLLRQVLFNLVLNAIQAVGRDGEIQIEARRRNATEASIEIRDNGPGVPAGQRTEIFKPYFTTQQKGTGLGLAIVQQIVLAHGWEVECLSNEPKGAIFRITHLKLTAKH